MGRYLLVEFDDNDSADRMRAQIDAAEAKGRGFRVVAVFAKPNRLCGCGKDTGKSVKGARLGWWVCPTCRRPKQGAPQTISNLLDAPGTPARYKEAFLVALRWINRDGRVTIARSREEKDWR